MTNETEKPRRLRGEGTVECRGPGRWRFKSVDGAGGRFVSKAEYPDETAALAALATFQKKVLAGQLVPTRSMTLRDYYDTKFLPRLERLVARGDRRKGTLAFYESHWPRLAGLADRPLRSLDVPTITKWADELADEVDRPKAFLAVLGAMLQSAVSVDFIIPTNPVRDVKLEKKKTEDDEIDRAPTDEESAALLSCERIPRADRLMIAFALGAGLRPGEWRTLELVDVHLDEQVPYVYVQFGTEEHGGTKTGKKRKVPLLSLARAALEAWLKLLPSYAPKNPHGLVFPTVRGNLRTNEPFGRRKVSGKGKKQKQVNRWHEFLRLAGVTRRLTPHGLRHGCATGLLTGALGERHEPWVVQLLLGHDKLATTERYLHHSERDLFREIRDRSPISPGPRSPERGNALISAVSALRESMVPTGGLEPSDSSRLRVVAASQAENGSAGTDRGLIWSRLLDRIAVGDWPTEMEARAIAAVARAAREEADPVLLAVRRVESTAAWQSGLLDLVRLMADATPARERKDGAS